MAQVSKTFDINGFWSYFQGWKWHTSGSHYFGKSPSSNEDFGPMCVSFTIPSDISNFTKRNGKIKFSFSLRSLDEWFNERNIKYYITTSKVDTSTKKVQGQTATNMLQKETLTKKIIVNTSSFTTITTAEIILTDNAKAGTTYYCWFYIDPNDDSAKYEVKNISATVYYDSYTACKAPTSVYFTTGSKTKNSPYTCSSAEKSIGVKLAWDGAAAGASNAIKSYQVESYINGAWTVLGTTTSKNYTITGTRGYSYSYRVKTIGSVTGYNSGYSDTAYIYYNSAPTKPSGSDKIVASSTTSTNIPITIPKTNYSYKTNTRTMQLWWKSSTQSEWKNSGKSSQTDETWVYNFPVTEMPNPGASKIYQFKMVDSFGDESDILKISLTRANKVAINDFTVLATAKTREAFNIIFKCDTAAIKDSIKISLFLLNEETNEETEVSSKTIKWTTEEFNLFTDGPSYTGSAKLKYKFEVKVHNEFNETATRQSTDYFTLDALPTISKVTLYNQKDTTNIKINGVERYFDYIRAVLSTNLNTVTASAFVTIGTNKTSYPATLTDKTFVFQLNKNTVLNQLDVSPTNGTINFKFSYGTQIVNNFKTTISFSAKPSIKSISFQKGGTTFQPYNLAKEKTDTVFMNGNFSDFGLSQILIARQDKTTIEPITITSFDNNGTNGIKKSGVEIGKFFAFSEFDDSERKGNTLIKNLVFTFKNPLGIKVSFTQSCTLDFRKAPEFTNNFKDFKYRNNISDPQETLGSKKVCEGTRLQFTVPYSYYGRDTIKFSLYLDNQLIATTSITPTSSSNYADGTSAEWQIPEFQLGRITKDSISIKVTAEIDDSHIGKKEETKFACKYQDPGLVVLSYDLSDNGSNTMINLTTNPATLSDDYNVTLIYGTSTISPTTSSPYSFKIGQINSNITARLKIAYQYPSNATRTDVQISYSNTFIIYGQTATVSYRKHYIGINNPSPTDDAVIDITATQGRDKIKFSDGTNIIIELDLSKVYDSNNNTSYPAITVKKGATEYTLLFD